MKQLFGIVLGSTMLVWGLIAPVSYAQSSSLSIHVPAKEVNEGDRITINVRVRSTNQSINAVSGTLIYPDSLVRVIGISKDRSIINLWTREPMNQRNRILFEGIVLNPGFQGSAGEIFSVTFEAKRAGTVNLTFTDGAVLANDGLGSNIVSTLTPGSFRINTFGVFIPVAGDYPQDRIPALPVITEFSASVDSKGAAFVKGKGEPNALTKIVFENTEMKSIGELFISMLQTKKKDLSEVLVKNNEGGLFEYNSPKNLIAGAYNATPYLVDEQTQTEKPGLGVQLFVNDSKLVRILVVAINVLALLIPVVGLIVVIYFIPWYSFRRMRIIKRKLGLEEEKIQLSAHQIQREDKIMDRTMDSTVASVTNQGGAMVLVPEFPQRPFPTQEPKR